MNRHLKEIRRKITDLEALSKAYKNQEISRSDFSDFLLKEISKSKGSVIALYQRSIALDKKEIQLLLRIKNKLKNKLPLTIDEQKLLLNYL